MELLNKRGNPLKIKRVKMVVRNYGVIDVKFDDLTYGQMKEVHEIVSRNKCVITV